MALDDTRRLGFAGSAEIDGVQVLITSGAFDRVATPSYLNMVDIKPDTVSRSKVKHADGTEAYTGSVSFDVTLNAMGLFTLTKLLGRRYVVPEVGIYDGNSDGRFVMNSCYVSSLSLSGSPGGLIAASMSFAGASTREPGSVDADYLLDYTSSTADQPLGYWWSGAGAGGGAAIVRDWSFSYTQDVTPVYSNEDQVEPRYLKVGLISYNLQVTMYAEAAPDKVYIATDQFTLVGDTTADGYTYNGPSDFGMYSHSFETSASASDGSGGIIIT